MPSFQQKTDGRTKRKWRKMPCISGMARTDGNIPAGGLEKSVDETKRKFRLRM